VPLKVDFDRTIQAYMLGDTKNGATTEINRVKSASMLGIGSQDRNRKLDQ